MKKIISGLLAACLLVGTLSGCNSSPAAGGDKPMGRYVEEQGPTLEGVKQVYQTLRDEAGGLLLYTAGQSPDGTVYSRCVLPQGGDKVENAPIDWLNQMVTQDESIVVSSISQSPNGTLYVLIEQNGGYALYRAPKDGVGQRVEVPDWAAPGEGSGVSTSGDGVSISGIAVEGGKRGSFSFGEEGESAEAQGKRPGEIIALDSGFLTIFWNEGVFHYEETGALKAQYLGTTAWRNVAVSGGTLVMSGQESGELIAYDLTTGRQSSSYTYDSLSYTSLLGMDSTGLYLADGTGIYRQAKDGSIWERLVEGDLTSLAMPNQMLQGLVGDGKDGFYGVLNSEDTYQIVHYVYDPNTPTTPDTELTIFSLKDNNTVRQAIGEFQRKNPNVRVTLRVGLPEGSSATEEDVVRALNTEILAGKAPDLLVLDGLPVDSYIEKGVLADLTSLRERLVTEQNLMSNVTNAFERDGKIYGIPSRFALPIMLGEQEALDKTDSLTSLLEQVKARQGEEIPFLYTSQNLWEDVGVYLDYFDPLAAGFLRDGAVDTEALEDYLDAVNELNQIMREKTPQLEGMTTAVSVVASVGGSGYEAADMGIMGLADGKARMHTMNLSGLVNLQFILSNLGGDAAMGLAPFFGGDSYRPMGSVGVTASGKQQELAQSFVEMILSPTVQDKYLYDGLAVNGASLEQAVQTTAEGNGGDDMGFLSLCQGLATPIFPDYVLKNAVSDQISGLIDKTLTPAEAVSKVEEAVRLYFSE